MTCREVRFLILSRRLNASKTGKKGGKCEIVFVDNWSPAAIKRLNEKVMAELREKLFIAKYWREEAKDA